MAFADFENLLKESIGLDAASIGASAVERAVLERASACGLAEPGAYWQHVGACPVELQALIEAVVVLPRSRGVLDIGSPGPGRIADGTGRRRAPHPQSAVLDW